MIKYICTCIGQKQSKIEYDTLVAKGDMAMSDIYVSGIVTF